ncbi:MAG: AAA family ATPase [Betaproteobacteria bacterium]|nr:AAA family ATPase [Betaproteobacteria bacterium]
MYTAYYGFTGKPFQLNPDPRFFYASREHKRAMAFVEYGLHQGEGFIVITGEIGAGKTTVVRNLLGGLDPDRVTAANLVTTQLEADDTLRLVAAAFGVNARGLSKADALLALEASLATQARDGRRCLLVVDEAQNLAPRAVEELRMLSNFQLGTHALLQTFLVGQPEFRNILRSPEFNQLRQRVIAACHIGALDVEDTRHYVEHRLRRVGWTDNPAIPPEVYGAVHASSGGIPRRINLIIDRMLLAGYLGELRAFTPELAREVADEIAAETLSTPAEGVPHPLPAARSVPSPALPGAMALTLSAVEDDIQQIKASLDRVESENRSALGTFRQFLDWLRADEGQPKKRA